MVTVNLFMFRSHCSIIPQQRSVLYCINIYFYRFLPDPGLWAVIHAGYRFAGITAYYIMKRDGRGWHVHIFDFTMYCGLSGIVGGRLWDVFFFDWAYYHNHLTEIPYVWQGGMAIQGGLLFGAVAGILYTKYHHIDTWAFADLLAPAIILGQSIGRMANLMNGDAFGHPTGGDFGIVYPDTTLAYHVWQSALVAGRSLGRPD